MPSCKIDNDLLAKISWNQLATVLVILMNEYNITENSLKRAVEQTNFLTKDSTYA